MESANLHGCQKESAGGNPQAGTELGQDTNGPGQFTGPYQPLPHADSFRVLLLQPAADLDAPIHCGLEDARLSDSWPDERGYDALSYVWGEPDATCVVLCDNKPLSVTPSCLDALRYLRRPSSTRRLWVDAVCINQSVGEKNHQVALMGRIYERATLVVAWFGRADDETEAVFAYLQAMSTGGGPASATKPPAEAMQRQADYILDHDWLRRMWTLQEAVLARRLVVQRGHACMDWHAAYAPRGLGNPVKFLSMILLSTPSKTGQTLRDAYQSTTAMVLEGRHRVCKDLHDKAYGMFGVLQALGAAVPPPDYRLPLDQVYTATAATIIELMQSLWMLTTIHKAGPALPGLPSWAPDLASREMNFVGRLSIYHDDMRCRAPQRPHLLPPPHDRRLRVVGRRLAPILSVMPPIPGQAFDHRKHRVNYDNTVDRVRAITSWMAFQPAAVLLSDQPPSRSSVEEALLDLFRKRMSLIDGDSGREAMHLAWRAWSMCAVNDNSLFLLLQSAQSSPPNAPDKVFFNEFVDQLALQTPDVPPHTLTEGALWIMVSLTGYGLLLLQDSRFVLYAEETRRHDIVVLLDGLDNAAVLRPAEGGYAFVGLAHTRMHDSERFTPDTVVDGKDAEFFTLV